MSAPIPLAVEADALLVALAETTGAPAIAALDGATLLGERAAIMGLCIPGRTSAGGGCRLHDAAGDTVALNLARAADRELLPALFADDAFDPNDDAAIGDRIAGCDATALVMRAREMGLAIARTGETACPAPALPPAPLRAGRPRVLDLAALWAGPLAAHLLWLAGADVVKVESPARPDTMRAGQPGFYDLLNQGKASVALDLRDPADRAALIALIAGADIVIEAARPRALAQLGIDADALVAARPGLVWITITAHGMAGDAANWVGFGDDVGIAAGLGAAMARATGRAGFVGDAIADPLTGIAAAGIAWDNWASGRGGRHGIAMRDVAARVLAQARCDPGFDETLRRWAAAEGQPFPPVPRRTTRPARRFGADRPVWPC